VTGLSIGMGTSWFSLVTAEMILRDPLRQSLSSPQT
jgi:ABC-type nitrate/sulfonate/bicarbonate transport system permease component